jgi:choline dehydrogenase
MDFAQTYDYVVVGGGTAGCILAARLSAQPERHVLLIEAGPADLDPRITRPAAWPGLLGSELDWGYRTVPQTSLYGRRLVWPRGRVLGGSGAINAMVHIRGAASDFDAWASWGGQQWDAQHMMPYLERLEVPANSCLSGFIPIAENTAPHPFAAAFVAAAQKYGLPGNPDFNRGSQEGVGLYRTTRTADTAASQARRANTAYTHLHPVTGRPNLTVLTEATVLGVVVHNGRASEVRVHHSGFIHTIGITTEVVLCAGTVASPQLLLLSGIGPADQLSALGIPITANLPGVGDNLHDHIQVSIAYDTFIGHPVSDWSNLGEAGGFVTLLSDSSAPDIQLSFAPMKDLNNASRLGYGFTIGPALTRPRSRGRLTLASADPHAHPRIDPAYLSDPADLDLLVDGVRLARDIAATDPLASLRSEPPSGSEPTRRELKRFVRTHAQTQFHPVGTCRFGQADDEGTVVDLQLRVRGVAGLRVVDASVIPNMITGNIHAAVAAIAERAAEFIEESSA